MRTAWQALTYEARREEREAPTRHFGHVEPAFDEGQEEKNAAEPISLSGQGSALLGDSREKKERREGCLWRGGRARSLEPLQRRRKVVRVFAILADAHVFFIR